MSHSSRLYDILTSYKPESFRNESDIITAFPKMYEKISNEIIQVRTLEENYKDIKMGMMHQTEELNILKKPISKNVESILDSIHDIVKKISENCACEIDSNITSYYESLMCNAEMTMRLTLNQLDCYINESDKYKNIIENLQKDNEYLLNKSDNLEFDFEKYCIIIEKQKNEIEILKSQMGQDKLSNCQKTALGLKKNKAESGYEKTNKDFVVNGEAENLPQVSITQSLTEVGLDFDKIIANLTFSVDRYKKDNEKLQTLVNEKDCFLINSQEKVKTLKSKIIAERQKFKKDWEWFQNSIKERNFIIGNLENDKTILEKELFSTQMTNKNNTEDRQDISRLSIIDRRQTNPNTNNNDSLLENLKAIDKYEDHKVLKNCQSDSALKNFVSNDLINVTADYNSNDNTIELGVNKHMSSKIRDQESLTKTLNDRIHFLEVELGLAEKLCAEQREKRLTDQEYFEKLLVESKKFNQQTENIETKNLETKNREIKNIENSDISTKKIFKKSEPNFLLSSQCEGDEKTTLIDFVYFDPQGDALLCPNTTAILADVTDTVKNQENISEKGPIDIKKLLRYNKNLSGEQKMIYCKFVDYATRKNNQDMTEVERGLNVSMQLINDFQEYINEKITKKN